MFNAPIVVPTPNFNLVVPPLHPQMFPSPSLPLFAFLDSRVVHLASFCSHIRKRLPSSKFFFFSFLRIIFENKLVRFQIVNHYFDLLRLAFSFVFYGINECFEH